MGELTPLRLGQKQIPVGVMQKPGMLSPLKLLQELQQLTPQAPQSLNCQLAVLVEVMYQVGEVKPLRLGQRQIHVDVMRKMSMMVLLDQVQELQMPTPRTSQWKCQLVVLVEMM